MLHNKLERREGQTRTADEQHYGVNINGMKNLVLVQVQDIFGSQARVAMSPKEAREMAGLLNKWANEIEIHRRKEDGV